MTKEAPWTNVAPGVWERTNSEGRHQRLGYGAGGLRAVLDRARHERASLLAHPDRQAVAAQLGKNQALIADLEAKLPAVIADEWKDTGEPPISTQGSASGSVCGASYTFDVIAEALSLVNYKVTATATISEPGPFAPFYKTAGTYTSADGGNGYIDEDSDSIGPFRGTCCAQVSSSAIASLTYSPLLYGLAYLQVTSGCNAFRSYDESL